MSELDVMVNGELRQVERDTTVDDMVRGLGLEPALIVVERNREILARGALTTTMVESGDHYELVHFVGGG